MNFLDGLDDDFEVAPRQSRPVTTPLSAILQALVDSDVALPPLPPTTAASHLGAPWHALERAVVATLHAVRGGDFVSVLRCEAACQLLCPVVPEEWEVLPPSRLSSPEGMAAAGGLPSPADFSYISCTLFARRLARYVLHGEGDDFFLDAPGSTDTPRHWRAAQAAIIAAACLGLYTQSNFTGPEVERSSLGGGIYPLPWLASLLPEGASGEQGALGGDAAGQQGSAAGSSSSSSSSGGVAGLAPVTLFSRRQWGEGWLLEEEAAEQPQGEGSASAGEAAATAPTASAAATPAQLPKQPPLFTAALGLLSPPSLGDSAYPLTSLAHYLGTARALLAALARPVPGGAAAVAWGAAVEGREGAREDPRVELLHALTDSLPHLAWLAGRAAVLHFRCLTGGGKGAGGGALLFKECAGLYARASTGVCKEYSRLVFGEEDAFRRALVGSVLHSSGCAELRGGGSSSGGGAAQAELARSYGDPQTLAQEAAEAQHTERVLQARAALPQAPGTGPRCHAARLLLEWGLAQHAFKKTAGAKTSFFLAKAESGLSTLLTGALGKRLKHQSFFTTQLVLCAASSGEQGSVAVEQGAEALRLGAAQGRFSGEGEEGGAPEGGGGGSSNSSSSSSSSSSSGEAGSEGSAPQPVPRTVLGGLRQVTLAESDPKTEVLEDMRLAEGCSAEEKESAVATKAELFYGKNWAASIGLQGGGSTTTATTTTTPPALADAPLSILDQCIVLALCLDVSNHNPEDGLTVEEMRPYVARVLDTPLNWSVHSTALYLRALLEFENHRTSDRAALQLAALADAAQRSAGRLSVFAPQAPATRGQREDGTDAPQHRLSHAPALFLPSVWELKREVGERYMRLGAIRDALAVFSALELWEEVLACLRLLDRPKKAMATVRMLLASVQGDPGATQQLACYLCSAAALADSDEQFAEAWRVSGEKYAPAALALGRRCGGRGQWKRAEAFLAAGLRVAPGDGGGWFLLGVACMRQGCLEAAANAFSRTVQLDASRADAWANMGSIFLQQQEWGRGYAALEQAIKADKEDWRIFSNLVTAAVRTGNYSRAISAMGQLVGLAVRGGRTGETGDEEDRVGEGGMHLPALTQTAKRVLDSVWREREREREGEASGSGSSSTAASASAALPAPLPEFDPLADSPLLPPAPSSLELEEEEGEGAGGAAQAPAELAVAEMDRHAHLCLEPLARLLQRITGSLRPPATVWAIYADVEEARGDLPASQVCRERQWRSLLGWPQWERSQELLQALALCTERLLVAGGVLVGRGDKAAGAWREQARYYVSTLVARVQAAADGLVEHPALTRLQGMLPE